MGFTQGAKITANILDEIVNGLLFSGVWHNVDTTWKTVDKTQNNARRVLAYGTVGGIGKGNTVLSADIIAGPTAKTILVTDSTNFAINDKIVIGSGNIAEVRVVTGAAPGTITFDAAINTDHLAGEPVKELDLEIYLAMEIINQAGGMNYYHDGSYWRYGKGFRFVFSLSWDAAAHIYPVSNQSTFVSFEQRYRYTVIADLGPTPVPPAVPTNPGVMVTYWLWIEDNGNGFTIMGKPEPTGDDEQQSFIVTMERNPAKEYADGYTNFYIYKSCNRWQMMYDGNNLPDSTMRDRAILRPFAYQWPDGSGKNAPGPASTPCGGTPIPNPCGANGTGISFVPMPLYHAFKSTGNNKVYFVKPLIHNHAGQYSPIFQSNLFFLWSEGVGLIDGDVVSIEGTTTKFLCKAVESPGSTSRLTYGIKYVA